jgi:hypothetical protein
MASQPKRAVRCPRRTRNGQLLAPGIEQLEDRQLLSGSPSASAFNPAEIRGYYGFNNITFFLTETIVFSGRTLHLQIPIPGDGTGQTIAIIAKYENPQIQNDVDVFDQQYGLPALSVTVDKLATVPGPDPKGNWEKEEAIDVEWAHAIAPGANIVVINYGPSLADLLGAVSFAKNIPGVSVVSMSLSGTEFSGETADDSYFTNPSNHGGVNVSFVAGSGDDKYAPGAEWPGVSPNVLAVGGTNLVPSGNGYSEISWQYSTGGISLYESEPDYQLNVQQSGFRSTPDVAYNAVNYNYYDSYSSHTVVAADWSVTGGTSFGAPQWAALIAIANQGRVLEGKPTLGDTSATSVPSAIYSLPYTDFNDILSGPSNQDGFAPEPGYDEVTGRGSPIADLLVPDFVALNAPRALPPFPLPTVFVYLAELSGQDLSGGLTSPAFTGVVPEPTGPATKSVSVVLNSLASEGNLGAVTTVSAGDRSDRSTFRSTDERQSSSSANSNTTSSLEAQWVGLNAALEILNACAPGHRC